MKRNVVLFVLLLVLMPALALAELVSDSHFNALKEGGWNCFGQNGGQPTIATDSSSPDPSSVLQINFPAGWIGGYFPAECDSGTFNSTEIYQQVYVKFPAGYQWHTVYNKISYDYLATTTPKDNVPINPGNLYIGVAGPANGGPYIMVHLQPIENKPIGTYGRIMLPNVNWTWGDPGTWIKLSWYLKLNDSGLSNGIVKVWVNDILNLEYYDMNMRQPIYADRNFTHSTLLPIWGGMGETKAKNDYFFMDRAILSTTPIAGGSVGAIQKEPKPPNNLIIK